MARIPERLLDGGGPDKPTTAQLAATLKSDIQTSRTQSDALLGQIAADKQAAVDAKKAAETALIQATGANNLEEAKTAAAKKDVSKNPGVIAANRALAAATAAANTAKSQQSSGGGGGGGGSTGGKATTYTAPDGKVFTDLNAYNTYIAQTAAEEKRRKGQSAFDILSGEFERYGMGSLLNDVKSFIVDGLSRDELLLKLRATPAYDKRFAANAQRIKSGLRALSEAEYIQLEDQYQNVMRNYGLPASYYTRGDMGVQQGFEKFIAGDVSAAELEDRIQTAQNRVINAAPEVTQALKQFYPDISNGDILAYALDPSQALTNIKRKVTAAEIGAGAMQAGLGTSAARAEELQRFGVTGEAAREGFRTIGGFLPQAQVLGERYAKQGFGPYTQTTAEAEVFGTTGAVESAQKRRKLAELEAAQFSGTTGAGQGALGRERAGQF